MPLTFDTLQYTKQAVEAGFSQSQAEFQAEKMAELVGDTLVTKTYFSRELLSVKNELTNSIAMTKNDLKSEFQQGMLALENRMTTLVYRMTGMIVGGMTLVIGAIQTISHVLK